MIRLDSTFSSILAKPIKPDMRQLVFAKLPVLFTLLVVISVITTNSVYAQTISPDLRNKSYESKSSERSVPVDSKSVTSGTIVIPLQFQIFNIGVVDPGDSFSQGFRVSPGGVAVGRSIGSIAQAFTWTQGGGIIGLPNLTGRSFCVSNGANDTGDAVGTCSTTIFGSSPLPTIWQSGTESQLPLPAGETVGRANDINASSVAVGSVDGGSAEEAVIYTGSSATVITQTTPGGSSFTTAFGVNDSGRIVGPGTDPMNAARNVGMVFDIGSTSAFEVGALSGANGAISFGVSNAGHVVGSSMMNQGSGMPFIYSDAGGIAPIPLPTGTSQGSARAVNSAGWAVGTASSAFAIPFLYDGTNTHRLQDLIPSGTGWDLSMNTSSSALGISENSLIVGTGVFNGDVRAYAMVLDTNVSYRGRIISPGGRGVANAIVTLFGGDLSTPLTTRTNQFGYYNFYGLTAGQTYNETVFAKQ